MLVGFEKLRCFPRHSNKRVLVGIICFAVALIARTAMNNNSSSVNSVITSRGSVSELLHLCSFDVKNYAQCEVFIRESVDGRRIDDQLFLECEQRKATVLRKIIRGERKFIVFGEKFAGKGKTVTEEALEKAFSSKGSCKTAEFLIRKNQQRAFKMKKTALKRLKQNEVRFNQSRLIKV